MATQILYARVKQKKATEAVWLANPLILLDGEVAYVVDPTDPAVVTNYKIGVGDKTFAQLPYVIHYAVDATFQPVKKYENVSSDQVVTGIFKKGTMLTKIPFFNTSAGEITVKLGTTSGGSELGQFTFSDTSKVLDINKLFEDTKTLYISGLVGHTVSFYVEYTPYGEAPIKPPAGGTTSFRYPKGHLGSFYELYDGHLEENFNTATGNGLPGTSFENCALTGTNGLVDMSNAYLVGIAPGGTSQALLGNTNNQVTLVKNNLPPLTLDIGLDKKGGNQGYKVLSEIYPGPNGNGGKTFSFGGNSTPFNIQGKSIAVYFFVAITD